MIDLLAYVATAVILAAYASQRPRWFNVANAITWPLILWSAASHRAWPSAIITVAFGLIGIYGLWRSRK